jgi:hypothetical protein
MAKVSLTADLTFGAGTMEGVANAKLVVRMALAADAQDRAVPGISELAYATYSVASTSSHFSLAMPVPSVCL